MMARGYSKSFDDGWVLSKRARLPQEPKHVSLGSEWVGCKLRTMRAHLEITSKRLLL